MARGIDGRSPEYAAGRLSAIKICRVINPAYFPVALRLPGRRNHKPTDVTLPLPGASRSAPESKYPRLFVPAALSPSPGQSARTYRSLRDVLAQLRRVVRLGVATTTLRNDNLQTFFCDVGGVLFPREKKSSNAITYPPNRRLRKPFFSSSMKRKGRSSPSRRSTVSA